MIDFKGYDLNPSRISDPEVRKQFEILLNIVESQYKEIQRLKEENQRLRDENNRLKGEQGKPNIPPKNRDVSSSKERAALAQKKKKKKRKKNKQKKTIARTVDCTVDQSILPTDAVFKGYETNVIPELIIKIEYVEYIREKYYSGSENKTYLAPLPEGYTGQFSPSIRAGVITLKHDLKMTEANITRFLNGLGCEISNATISRMLTKDIEIFHQEKEAVTLAGIQATPYVQTDDTMARVKGENHHSHILCNPYFTSYSTEERKDRSTVLDVLRLKRPRVYCIDQETLWILEQMNLPEKRKSQLNTYQRAAPYTKEEIEDVLGQLFPDRTQCVTYQQRILEAAYISGYHLEPDHIQILICDDAPQFKLLTYFLALCWVHEGRHYKKLQPVIPYHRKQLNDFQKAFWEYYGKLLDFKEQPSDALAIRLILEFDALCDRDVTYSELQERIIKTKANKTALLTVLSHPEVPLHNNASELGARTKARERDIRLHSMSPEGIAANDTFLTLIETARKLGVNSMDYIYDRVSGICRMPALADLIMQQAALSALT